MPRRGATAPGLQREAEMIQVAVEDDLQSTVLAMRADVRASLALSRVAIQTLEALCPEGEWLEAPALDTAAIEVVLDVSDERVLVSAIECALIEAADALGDIDAFAA